jgi:L-rhamnose-H+ transport protein
VNLIWFLIAGIRNKTLNEFVSKGKVPGKIRSRNYLWSALAGTLWTGQFFFYGLGHVQMGKFQFISWVLHMSMLIFFSYIVGVLMKEWKQVQRKTFYMLIVSLVLLFLSSVIISYGSTFQQ